MKTFAKMTILGHVGNEPDTRYNNSGSVMASFVVYTNNRWKDKTTGQLQERSERHNIVAFGRPAEIVRDYVKKGAKLYLEAEPRTRKWTDQNQVERYTTEYILSEINLLDRAPEKTADTQPEMATAVAATPADDDIPF